MPGSHSVLWGQFDVVTIDACVCVCVCVCVIAWSLLFVKCYVCCGDGWSYHYGCCGCALFGHCDCHCLVFLVVLSTVFSRKLGVDVACVRMMSTCYSWQLVTKASLVVASCY